MVVLSVMVELYVFGGFLFVVLGLMAYINALPGRVILAVFLVVNGGIFCLGVWGGGQNSLSSQTCVATVTAQEGWEDMSITELHSAAKAAVASQPVSPNGPEWAADNCFSELQAKAQPNSTTSEN